MKFLLAHLKVLIFFFIIHKYPDFLVKMKFDSK